MAFKSFEELEVYKAAREYRKKIYRLIKELPDEEKYNLAGQMRRAALSLTNNIAGSAPYGGELFGCCLWDRKCGKKTNLYRTYK